MKEILYRAVNLEQLVRTNPEVFDFSKLEINDKIKLLQKEPSFYLDKINVDISIDDKVHIITLIKNKAVQKKFELTPIEINKIRPASYMLLLNHNFHKYITKEKFLELAKCDQQELFTIHPDWVIQNIDKPPILTSERLQAIAKRKPEFIDTHIKNISEYSTTALFWVKMIKYDKKYEDLFIINTKTLMSKTEVRRVCRLIPRLIKKLNADIVYDSKLTCKEWITLINTIMLDSNKEFENWQFPDDIIEAFKLDLTSEVLSGKSKMTKRFQNSIKGVFKEKVEEDQIEMVI